MSELEQYVAPIAAVRDHQSDAVSRLAEWAQSATAASHVAEQLVRSSFVPESFRGKAHEATAAILAGLEVGLAPMAALRSFDVIQGQAAPRAVTLRAIVQSQGHEIELVESTASRCKMRGRRHGSQTWQEVTWTFDRARQLGLTTKSNWKSQPQAMLVARATSEIARLVASDAILGIAYSIEEIADGVGGGVDVPAATAASETLSSTPGTRRMSRRAIPPPSDEVEVADTDDVDLDEDDPLSERVAAVMADMKALTDDGKAELKAWADGRKLSGAALLANESFLGHLEDWLAERAATDRQGNA
jgi:hypothetical protein